MTGEAGGRLESFVEEIREEVAAHGPNGLPERRKLRSILRALGLARKSTAALLDLQRRFDDEAIFVLPPLTDQYLGLDEWVRFSSRPLPPERLLFPTERELRRAILSAIGRVDPLRGLRTPRPEYRLRSGKRIDILCRDKRTGEPVAIELKRHFRAELAAELLGYLDELEADGMARKLPLRGIVISGSEDPTTMEIFRKVDSNHRRIDWLVYDIGLRRAAL